MGFSKTCIYVMILVFKLMKVEYFSLWYQSLVERYIRLKESLWVFIRNDIKSCKCVKIGPKFCLIIESVMACNNNTLPNNLL